MESERQQSIAQLQDHVHVRGPAPDFRCEAVVGGNFEELSLDYYMSRNQWLILLFIPMAFSFVCPTEVISYNNVIEEFTEQGCSVAFVSTDSKHSLYQWQSRPRIEGGLGTIRIPLMSDQNHKMSKKYGVLLEDLGYALRGMFIINPKGIIKHMSTNDIGVGRSVLETLRLLQAFKAEEEFGVYCAANWKPGETSEQIEPSFDGQQEYLKRTFGKLSVSSQGSVLSRSSGPSVSGTSSSFDHTADARSASVSSQREDKDNTPVVAADLSSAGTKKFTGPTPLEIPPPSKNPKPEFKLSPGSKMFSEAIHKVFGSSPASSPLPSPLAGLEDMDALNRKNTQEAKRKSGLQSVKSYFDYEPSHPAD